MRLAPAARIAVTRRAALVGLGAAAATTVGRPAAAATTVRFSYQRSSILLTLLKEDGGLDKSLEAKGFRASWHLFDDILQPMTAGAVDFHGDVADAIPVFAQSAGAPLTFYAKEERSPAAEAIIVRADSPVRSVADLKGKTVAVGRGSGSHFVLAAALKRAGLSFRDIKPAYLRPTDGAAAFERGSVDAWSIWDPYLAITESKVATRTLCDATGLSRYDRYYMVGSAFADAHPEVVGLVFDALVEMAAWVRAHQDQAVAKLVPLWGGMSPAVVEAVCRRRSLAVKPVTREGLSEQQLIADLFAEAGLIPKRIDATAGRVWSPRGVHT